MSILLQLDTIIFGYQSIQDDLYLMCLGLQAGDLLFYFTFPHQTLPPILIIHSTTLPSLKMIYSPMLMMMTHSSHSPLITLIQTGDLQEPWSQIYAFSSSEKSTSLVLRFTPSNPKFLSGTSLSSSSEDSIFSSPLSFKSIILKMP